MIPNLINLSILNCNYEYSFPTLSNFQTSEETRKLHNDNVHNYDLRQRLHEAGMEEIEREMASTAANDNKVASTAAKGNKVASTAAKGNKVASTVQTHKVNLPEMTQKQSGEEASGDRGVEGCRGSPQRRPEGEGG